MTGAIPPISEMQAMFWISLLKGQVRQPLPPPHYYLLVKETARIKYGVDHSTYMSTLAKDIGAAPVSILTGCHRMYADDGLGSLGTVAGIRDTCTLLLLVWRCLYDILPSCWPIPIARRPGSDQD
jgi:hypothetical protein